MEPAPVRRTGLADDSALAFFDDRTNVSVEFVAYVQMGMLVYLKAIEWNVRPCLFTLKPSQIRLGVVTCVL